MATAAPLPATTKKRRRRRSAPSPTATATATATSPPLRPPSTPPSAAPLPRAPRLAASALQGGLLAVPEAAPPPNLLLLGGGPSANANNAGSSTASLRPITLADFKAAMRLVGPSTPQDSAVMAELKAWQERYGEGGGRGTAADAAKLSYYM